MKSNFMAPGFFTKYYISLSDIGNSELNMTDLIDCRARGEYSFSTTSSTLHIRSIALIRSLFVKNI